MEPNRGQLTYSMTAVLRLHSASPVRRLGRPFRTLFRREGPLSFKPTVLEPRRELVGPRRLQTRVVQRPLAPACFLTVGLGFLSQSLESHLQFLAPTRGFMWTSPAVTTLAWQSLTTAVHRVVSF